MLTSTVGIIITITIRVCNAYMDVKRVNPIIYQIDRMLLEYPREDRKHA